MRPQFVIINPRADDIACNGNTQVLLFPRNSDCGLQLESSCYKSCEFPRPYVNITWVQHRLGITGFMHKTERKTDTVFFFLVTWQSMLYYPFIDHPWNNELEVFGHPAHVSPGLFWFLSPRTTKGDIMRLTVCSWWWCEGGSAWLVFDTSKEQVF